MLPSEMWRKAFFGFIEDTSAPGFWDAALQLCAEINSHLLPSDAQWGICESCRKNGVLDIALSHDSFSSTTDKLIESTRGILEILDAEVRDAAQ